MRPNPANQAVTDQTTIAPFFGDGIVDAVGQTETLSVTLSVPGDGTLTSLGGGSYDASNGVYTDAGSAASVTEDLDGLVFIPTKGQVPLGETVTTDFTISDSDTAASATDSTTSVIALAAIMPTIIGTAAGQTMGDTGTVTPFSGVTIGDANSGQTETVTVMLSNAANGSLSRLGDGTYMNGVYTDIGSAATVSSDLDGLVFTPTAQQVTPGQSVNTDFIISDTDTDGLNVADTTTTVIATAGTLVPTITGTAANQAVSDTATITPFGTVTIGDLNLGETEIVTVTPSNAANGVFSNLGAGGSYDRGTGVYTDTGSAAAVTSDLDDLVFTPTAQQVAPSGTVTTGFTVGVIDTAGASVTDDTTSVIATAGTLRPTIIGTAANQMVSDTGTITPFRTVTIADANAGQTETVTVTLSNAANGTLTNLGRGSYNAPSGVFTDSGSAATVTGDLDGLVFIPAGGLIGLGQTVTTGLTIIDADTAGASTTDTTTSVITTAIAMPTITGTTANQATTDQTTITPFANVVIADVNAGQMESVTVALSDIANGSLSNLGAGGSFDPETGVYTDIGTAAAVTSDLDGLLFNPTEGQTALGQAVTTGFAISDSDTAGASATPDTTTSVIATAAALPTITGTSTGQAVSDTGTITPFASVTIGDLNFGQTETVTVSLSNVSNGTLSQLGGGSYDVSSGVYTDIGSAATVSDDLDRLVFTPTTGRFAPGVTVTTDFIISATDTDGINVADTTTTVVTTTGTLVPTISNTLANQTVSEPATIMPFTTVTIVDPNVGQTETVTVTLSDMASGTLSRFLGNGSFDAASGVYTDSGSAAAVSLDLDGLVFTPANQPIATGGTVTTSFNITVSDTAGASVTDSTTSVIATALPRPTITGTMTGQAVDDTGTITPFGTVTIGDLNVAQTETVTVTLSNAANGSLGQLGGGTYDATSGVYTDIGSAAAVSSDLDGLVFTPTARQVAPGASVTTDFVILDTDTAGFTSTDTTTTVIATAGTLAPTISGTASGQAVSDTGTIMPFGAVAISDLNFGQTETVTVMLSNAANGTISDLGVGGSYDPGTNVYTDIGSAAAVSSDLDGLVFTPTPREVVPGGTVSTVFTITDTDAAGASTSDSTTSVIATTGTLLPTITGATAGQVVSDTETITPFDNVLIADLNSGQTETVTVTLSAMNGTLSNLGLDGSYDPQTGVYTDIGSPGAVSAGLDGWVFSPTAAEVAPGGTVSTVFTISVTDDAGARATDSTTTVIATAGAVLPTITGTTSAQVVTDLGTITPFSSVTVGDLNFGQTETVTVALSSAENGVLVNLDGGNYDRETGVYTDIGTARSVSGDLDGLVFIPTQDQTTVGQTVTSNFTINDSDTAGASATPVTTSVMATSVVVPTITGTAAGQATSDTGTITPFGNVAIGDRNLGQTETVTVTLSDMSNGSLSGSGFSDNQGVYTDIGNAAKVSNDLDQVVFTPTPHQVAPGGTISTGFIISDTDTDALKVADATTTVIATAGTLVPTITGTTANQAVTDTGTITPFSNVTIGDLNFDQTETVTVALSAVNGTLSGTGFSGGGGVYTDIGTAAAVSDDLDALAFAPAAQQIEPGGMITTGFTISVTDTAGASSTDDITSVIATAGTIVPTITGSTANQAVSDTGIITPFGSVTIGDRNFGQVETVTVTLSDAANGTLEGSGFTGGGGVYTDIGSATAVSRNLDGLMFTPAAQKVEPGKTITTRFTITATDTAGASSTDRATTVIATVGTLVPTIAGTVGNQGVSDTGTITPFGSVTISDLNFGQTETVTVILSAANGTLSGNGFLGGGGVYTDIGSPVAVNNDLDGLVFTPTAQQIAPGGTISTGFTITDTDTAGASSTDRTTSVIATVGTLEPTITGAAANQTVSDAGTIRPFRTVTIGDLNFGQIETVTVTTSAANGTLSGGGFSGAAGVYTDVGSASAVTTALDGLVFTPTLHQIAPGGTITTGITITDTDTAGASSIDRTTSVIATAGAVVPMITGSAANQAVSDTGTIRPCRTVTIADVNIDQTETVTVTLSDPANGNLSDLGGFIRNAGVYTGIGSASAVSAALDGLVFTPTPHQVVPGGTVRTDFTISDTDTARASTTQSVTSVIATASTLVPTITGTTSSQAVSDTGTIMPFGTVRIGDLNFGQTETVSVTLSAAANGSLSHLGGFIYSAGVYTETASATAVTAALDGFVFTPTSHQVPPGQTVTTGFTITDTDAAGAIATDSHTSVIATAGAVTPPPASNFSLFETTTNVASTAMGAAYSGPVAGLQCEYITTTTASLNITAAVPNVFIHTGSGNDAIAVSGGTNVLDGSTGSNFLVGATGDDTFFVDDREPTSDIWSTVVNFHSGDAATVWGVTPGDFSLSWVDGQGAAGYTGLTLHASAAGVPTASLTLAGFASGDLTNGRLTVSFGTTAATDGVPGSSYMNIHAN